MDASPDHVVNNVNAVVDSEEALAGRRSMMERLSNRVGGFVGTWPFVVLQLSAVAGWVIVNAGALPFLPPFDPFPYSLGGAMLSLEGVILAAFVLMRQSHESALSERRSHLNLQANLLVEQEVTKVIQMLQRQSEADGTAALVVDAESREMAQVTAVHNLAKELDRRLDKPR